MKKVIFALLFLSPISSFANEVLSISLKPGQELRAQFGGLSILIQCNAKCDQQQCQYQTHAAQGPFEHIRLEAGKTQSDQYKINDSTEVVCN